MIVRRLPLDAAVHAPQAGEVVVVHADADTALPDGEACLDAAERAHAARLPAGARRRRYVTAHAVLREVLGAALGIAPAAVAVARAPCTACGGPHGRPRLADRGHDLSFSLAHAGRHVVVAVGAGCEVGVDVEEVRAAEHAAEVLDDLCGPGEAEALARLAATDRPAATLAHWVRKEAVLKAAGTGLTVAPRTVALPPGPSSPGRPRPVRVGGLAGSVADVEVPRAVAAVCAAPAPAALAVIDRVGRAGRSRPGEPPARRALGASRRAPGGETVAPETTCATVGA